jgi:hypothetical protein
VLRPWAEELKPVVDMHIWTVALDMRSKASRQASAGGHFSIRSPRTEVAAKIVKSTSSIVYLWSVLKIHGVERERGNVPNDSAQQASAR